MIRDPLYQEIVARLEEHLDPELFERCASDLLRADYPTLVPVRGGCDSGQDGAISDGKGLPYPLVSTTEPDVIGNLAKSLSSYLSDGGERREVVLATSQELTPRRRRNLEKRAADLGFTLIQTYTQAAIAQLLYRSPEWCLELLNLTGDPPPLSLLPLTRRPLIGDTLIGRGEDLAWLQDTSGDVLLVGQPGSGKTFLQHVFAKEGGGLFVVTEDIGRIATGIRAQQPKALVVDDAHMHIGLIHSLRHLRSETYGDFRIVANCWPGQRTEVAGALSVTGSSIRELSLLTRDQMVEVIKASGIHGPNPLVEEIVSQAEGRPGLAVTLCHISLNGRVSDVALGNVLLQDIRLTFEPLVGPVTTAVLAAFAIGGDQGMPMEGVASSLDIPLWQLQQTATGLAAGGVLWDIGQDRLSVRPIALRFALVRDTFFKGAASLPIDCLIKHAPSIPDLTLTLIGARARGATVPTELLLRLLEESQSDRVWEAFCWLGSAESSWVLEQHPEQLMTVANAALEMAPDKVLPMLLDKAVGDKRPENSAPDHPLRLINDWVNAWKPYGGDTMIRREQLLGKAKSWFDVTQNARIALRAVAFVLSPALSYTETDPGRGLTFTIRTRYVTNTEFQRMEGLWPHVLDLLRETAIEDWQPILQMVHSWAYPRALSRIVNSEFSELAHSFTSQLLRDIISAAKDSPGISRWAGQIAQDLNIELNLSLDPEFELLFPPREYSEDMKLETDYAAASDLAQTWSGDNPNQIAHRLVLYEREAEIASLHWPRLSPLVCQEIAKLVANPTAWARALIGQAAPGDLIYPFLERALASDDPDAASCIQQCMAKPILKHTAASAVLSATIVPDPLFKDAMEALDEDSYRLVESLCLRRDVPEERVAQLLGHPQPAVAVAAAVGEWYSDPRGSVRPSIQEAWRLAIVNSPTRLSLEEPILKSDPSLALDWLVARVRQNSPDLWMCESLIGTAIETLNLDQRRYLLGQIGPGFRCARMMIEWLVGEEIDTYRDLLSNRELESFHLVPLRGHPRNIWIDKALLALDAGYPAAVVAEATIGSSWSRSGNESDMWAEWVQAFEPLLSHQDPRIQEVGQHGQQLTQALRDRALQSERREAVYGGY